MLELRPNCERCDRDLPPDDPAAHICSYECTYCAECVELLDNVCPTCGGNFEPRPIRPRTDWRRLGLGLANHPPSTIRRKLRFEAADVRDHVFRIRTIAPVDR